MTRYLISAVMVIVVAGGHSQMSEATPCGTGTYDQLTTACTDAGGDLTFSNFTYAASATGGAVTVLPMSVNYVTVNGPPFWGFNFALLQPPLTVVSNGSSQTSDILIGYTVTCTGARFNCIDSAELAMVGMTTGSGIASVSEIFSSHPLSVTASGPTFASAVVGTVHQGTVQDDISVIDDGTATITQVTNEFHQIPEPATLGLLSAGLFSLGALGRRRTSR
jgi:PEP-CTERM motif